MIAILIVLAIGGLVAYNVLGARDKADERLGTIQLREMQKSLRQFKVNHGRYPTEEEGLRVLWDKEAMTDEEALKNWEKLLEKPMPTDKWGSDWGYRQVSEHGDETMYDLWSFGPDKQEGTSDDIVSWDSTESDGTPSGGSSTGGNSGKGG
jgi:general secretion pathway protein G